MGYDRNEQRVFLIGDIHGCYQEFMALLAKIGWDEDADDLDDFRIILLGDLVDRGPKSAECVQFAREHGFEITRGNHDDRYVKYNEKLKWHANNPNNPQPSWLKKYPERKKILESLTAEDIEWLANAPTRIFLPDYNIVAVHAGFLPGVPMAEQKENTHMHVRFLFDRSRPAHLDPKNGHKPPLGSKFWAEDYEDKWDVVYGHHVWDNNAVKIHKTPNGRTCWGIDTGACFGGLLTAFELSKDGNHVIHQVTSSMPKKK
jgi:hypothetical protein